MGSESSKQSRQKGSGGVASNPPPTFDPPEFEVVDAPPRNFEPTSNIQQPSAVNFNHPPPRNTTQTPPPSYNEVQHNPNLQRPPISYQQNLYQPIPMNIGHYPHGLPQNYQQKPPVHYVYPVTAQNPYMNFGPQQFQPIGAPQHYPRMQQQFAPREFSSSARAQRFQGPRPQQPKNVTPKPPKQAQNVNQKQQNNQNPPKKEKKIPPRAQKAQEKAKEAAREKKEGSTPKPEKTLQKSGNQIILNLDELSSIKASSSDEKFMEFSKQLNKAKFKPPNEARKSLVNNKHLSDIKFVIDNEIIYGHKLFLATSSAKFYKHFHVDGNAEMKVDGIDKNTFLNVISYCYCGHLKVNEENVLGLLLAANLLEIRQITNICSGFINNKMNPETIFVIFEKAIENKVEEFQKKCLDFIVKNEDKCFQSKGFYEISLPSLMKILNALSFDSDKSNQLIEKWTTGCHKVVEESPSKPTGAVKKPNKKEKKIPCLMDLPLPSHEEFKKFYETQKPIRPFAAASVENLINFDDDDDVSGIICKDDSDDDLTSEISFGGHPEKRTTFVISGKSEDYKTEFSRVDFNCLKSINVHEIWFNVNLFANVEHKSIRMTIVLVEDNKKTTVHTRFIKRDLKPGMKLNYVKFSKKPLQFFFGQKWFIKINFSESAKRAHLQPTKIAPTGTLELRVDEANKKYFNCINKIVVSEIN